MRLERKKEIAEELHEKFQEAEIVILTDYKGLDVTAMNELRKKLRAENIDYRVVKNTLLARASEGTPAALIRDRFKGPSAIALSMEDPVAPAKVLSDFAKDNKKLEIRVAVMKGDKLLELDDIKALSTLPSSEVLLAQVLSVMNAVPTGLVRALSDVPRRLLNVLNAVREQKEAAA